MFTPRDQLDALVKLMTSFTSRISPRHKFRHSEPAACHSRCHISQVEPGWWTQACMSHIERLEAETGMVRHTEDYSLSSLPMRLGRTSEYCLEDTAE